MKWGSKNGFPPPSLRRGRLRGNDKVFSGAPACVRGRRTAGLVNPPRQADRALLRIVVELQIDTEPAILYSRGI